MSEWQPIETAPKDGTRVLVYSSWVVKATDIARWIGPPHNIWKRDREGDVVKATHWMPLPDPPAAIRSMNPEKAGQQALTRKEEQ